MIRDKIMAEKKLEAKMIEIRHKKWVAKTEVGRWIFWIIMGLILLFEYTQY
jgi:hypothetical protein